MQLFRHFCIFCQIRSIVKILVWINVLKTIPKRFPMPKNSRRMEFLSFETKKYDQIKHFSKVEEWLNFLNFYEVWSILGIFSRSNSDSSSLFTLIYVFSWKISRKNNICKKLQFSFVMQKSVDDERIRTRDLWGWRFDS